MRKRKRTCEMGENICIFALSPNKGLIAKIYKDLIQLRSQKKKKKSSSKMSRGSECTFPKEDIQRANRYIK